MNNDDSQSSHIPRATYRLQFTPDFGFADARKLVPYLQQLGISDIYCSPILTARPGSMHGYDVIDPLHINPELGGYDEFERLAFEAKRHDMSLLIDIVPNHMAASIDNTWWYDVLENGPSSRYAHFFDIEWDPPDPNESLHNRVLLPILGAPYGETLENGEIQLAATDRGYELRYYEHHLPLTLKTLALILTTSAEAIAAVASAEWASAQQTLDQIAQLPGSDHYEAESAQRRALLRRQLGDALERLRTVPDAARVLDRGVQKISGTPGDPRSFDQLDRIVRRQAYRLAYWQIAREQINYRRFFDVNDLVSLRVEDDDVFDTTHAFILDLVRANLVDGLRIDHIDGLRDPENYLLKLRNRLNRITRRHRSVYVIVEKILAFDESLPLSWPIEGTTGYDVLNAIGDLYVDPAQTSSIDEIYRRTSSVTESFPEIVYQAKRELLQTTFHANVRMLTFNLEAISNGDRHGRDLTFESLQHALIETTAAMQVYRTYINSHQVSDQDRQRIEQAIDQARARQPDLRPALDFLARVLTLDIPGYVASARRADWLNFVMRWQQFCGPVMAKGNEDTALYRYLRLLSRNEVGGHPDRPPESLEAVHARFQALANAWPHTLIASSTHDTKRSEDVRARISALSEMAIEWGERLAHWQALNTDKRATRDAEAIPNGNLENLIYQTMIGAWPFDESERDQFHERLTAYLTKAVREAKEHSNWTEPDTVYEDAVYAFVDALFNTETSETFLTDFMTFQRRVARIGALNSLSQTLIKLTAPGIPDIYQGSELWDLSLVDPDNRRPVDYRRRKEAIAHLDNSRASIELLNELTTDWQSGRVKQFLIAHVLRLRRLLPALFDEGTYVPILAEGERAEHLFPYVRTHANSQLLVVAPRLCSAIIDEGNELTAARQWGETTLWLPTAWNDQAIDLFSGEPIRTVNVQGTPSLRITEILQYFPVGLVGNQRVIEELHSA